MVAIDYATKWIEEKPLTKIREKEMIEFFMEHVVFRFEIPRILVSDNGTQFIGAKFEKILDELKIQHIKASFAYPQANGLVEDNPSKCEKCRRVDLVINKAGETPFRLAYGVDIILLVEVSLISLRVEALNPASSIEGLKFHNDLLEEVREDSKLRMIPQQEKTAKYFNKKVKAKMLKVNDLVLRETAASQSTITRKLKPSWKGPYKITKVISSATYEPAHLDDRPIKNAWNGIHIKKFYK
ncbi:uncharacterized protein LOC141665925 [Apium graveolens]|uniref:uncharacterized protein LOC141665925 n=1 Tax=Apium graveolens TaxID=4045 RepID=UPI003D7B320E